jgi:hypothetical protein
MVILYSQPSLRISTSNPVLLHYDIDLGSSFGRITSGLASTRQELEKTSLPP